MLHRLKNRCSLLLLGDHISADLCTIPETRRLGRKFRTKRRMGRIIGKVFALKRVIRNVIEQRRVTITMDVFIITAPDHIDRMPRHFRAIFANCITTVTNPTSRHRP